MENLRAKYPEFVFDSFEIFKDPVGLHVAYFYKLGSYEFRPEFTIPVADVDYEEYDEAFLHELCFNFGVINAISYYKLACPPTFVINAGYLDDNQKMFFRKQFYNGLGEFMYINNINIPFAEFMNINCTVPEPESRQGDIKPANLYELPDVFNGTLIPVGGGKDSVVTLEALQPLHDSSLCFQFNRSLYPENHAALSCIREAGFKQNEIRNFNLTFDPLMIELSKQEEFLNGHIPFSATLAFASLISAYLSKKKYITVSNEASANEGNVAGTNINHQYSKSYEFEQDFQKYCKYYLTDKIQYFSLLRCLNEFQIVQKFLKHPNYLNMFRSCNVGMKENKWCTNCAKCLYVFIMLYPFVDLAKLKIIFGRDLLADPSMRETFNGLIHPDENKPFECVGTKEEICYTLDYAVQNYTGDKMFAPILLKEYANQDYGKYSNPNVPTYFNDQNSIPPEYLELIKNA